MGLARKLLNNPGLIALTLDDEKNEIRSVLFGADAARISYRRRIKFAFFQSDFRGGRVPMWHVVDPLHKSYQSTLSMEGLRDWGVL